MIYYTVTLLIFIVGPFLVIANILQKITGDNKDKSFLIVGIVGSLVILITFYEKFISRLI